MVNELGLFYLGGMTVLFFFWAYGIVSFLLDLKNKFIPKGKQYLRGRRRQKAKQDRKRNAKCYRDH
ncbi:hypothetical protein C9J85_04660 [Haloferax sp. wsp5]|nr:hypothetical protein C9J85_04660 [Haloferax sp. wsp5]